MATNWFDYNGADGKAYWFNPTSGEFKDKALFPTSPDAPPPAAAPAPAPAAGGIGGWTGAPDQSYRAFTPELQEFYEQNPTQAYSQYLTSQYGTQQTPLAQYAAQQYSRNFANYLQWSEGHPERHWTDYLSGDLANQIRQSFDLQTPGNKGYSLQWMPAGRFTG